MIKTLKKEFKEMAPFLLFGLTTLIAWVIVDAIHPDASRIVLVIFFLCIGAYLGQLFKIAATNFAEKDARDVQAKEDTAKYQAFINWLVKATG